VRDRYGRARLIEIWRARRTGHEERSARISFLEVAMSQLTSQHRGRDAMLVCAGLALGGLALLVAQRTVHSRSVEPAAVSASVAAQGAAAPEVAVKPAPPRPRVIVNGVSLDQATLTAFEQQYGRGIRPGDYWYDSATGVWGMRGGPAQGLIRSGLTLGGPLRADASGGGSGRLTGIYINGRELHPIDVAVLTRIVQQPIIRGRYWVDETGTGGREGGPAYFNLVGLARQAGMAGGSGQRCVYCGDHGTVGGDGSFLYYIDHDGTSATIAR
jgi:hypothetical protein